jgi:hypothetical protein
MFNDKGAFDLRRIRGVVSADSCQQHTLGPG